MPTSNLFQLNEILQLIKVTSPNALLDIGIGFGKYGFLAREYLELWGNQQNYHQWTRRIDGIEAFADYIGPLQRSIYNEIYLGNALDVLPTLNETYDLVLLIDVLEHFSREDGLKLLEECLRIGLNLLIAVPKPFSDQEVTFGNEFETHRFDWRKRDFAAFQEKFFLKTRCSLICYLGKDYRRVGRKTTGIGMGRRFLWKIASIPDSTRRDAARRIARLPEGACGLPGRDDIC